MDDVTKSIALLIEKRDGLKLESIGETAFNRAIYEKMKALALDDKKSYYERLVFSDRDFQELVEKIVVLESWFFRDQVQFTFIKQYVKQVLLLSKEIEFPIKILSLPCSTGEEPYSIAMQLLKAGLTKDKFIIDAVDISYSALRKAQTAVYSSYSFRNLEGKAASRQFFEEKEGVFYLKEEVKSCVRFIQSNVLDLNYTAINSSYHLILCKNLLIYMSEQAQKQIVKIVSDLLKSDGLLLVSPVEIEYIRKSELVPYPYKNACAFQKEKPLDKNRQLKKSSSFVSLAKQQSLKKMQYPQDELERGKKYADEGNFEEAYKICQSYLNKEGPHPLAYFILGLVEHAKGNEKRSEEYMLKTVYLDPRHYEALIYLALLFEKKGEHAHAKLYYNRAKKIETRSV